MLISHIPRVYADTKLSTPKKYSYVEWAFYLRLLGEDESNSALHRKARPAPHSHTHGKSKRNGAADADKPSPDALSKDTDLGDQTAPRWSWIGHLSPLMQEKDEAEWILERLFTKLEESLRYASEQVRDDKVAR